MRELVIANAGYWIDEFHLDGLRLDATQAIHDRSPEHMLAAIARRARAAGRGRHDLPRRRERAAGRRAARQPIGLDALWNDDFHHTARVALTGVREGYLHDYRGTPQELVVGDQARLPLPGPALSVAAQPARHARPAASRATRFVHFLENHDQVANVGFGERLADARRSGDAARAHRAAPARRPQLPMLFQGQETGARQPWQFFVDHDARARATRSATAARSSSRSSRGSPRPRRRPRCADPCARGDVRALRPRSSARATSTRRASRCTAICSRCAATTRRSPTAARGARRRGAVRPRVRAALPAGRSARDRLLLVNLGPTLRDARDRPSRCSRRRADTGWRVAWSSEDPRYGGHGTPPPFDRVRLAIPARAASCRARPGARCASSRAPRERAVTHRVDP